MSRARRRLRNIQPAEDPSVPFENTAADRIAIIGGGISGLAAAYLLSRDHDVTLFEAAPRLGGHSRTVLAGRHGDQPVDTGFIVFNYHTYPHLTEMFRDLDVPVKPSDMSFGVSVNDGALEYAMRDLPSMAAQTRNLARPQFWRMMNDIVRFNRRALAAAQDPDLTLGELLDGLGMGEWFRRYYLLPMAGAIWSSTPDQMAAFPARALIQFFHNHALLTPNTHQWYTVDGGSTQYVQRIAGAILRAGGEIRTGARVRSVTRSPFGVTIRAEGGLPETFRKVVFASHSDQALSMLGDATEKERSILGRIRFQDNRAVLHADIDQMPKRRRAWASWVYRSTSTSAAPRIGITYWMNSLQGIDSRDPLFVSLNPEGHIRDEAIYDETTFAHPVFDRDALAAQADLRVIQGANDTWFCGAWTRHGFHEDGYASAVAVVERMKSRVLAA
jgi:predicted NAD/FAD-binding protein